MESSKHIVFWLFCMGVPVFMAFNGGATAATVDTIQKGWGWSPTALGLLGAADKIGMTVSAWFWGYVLQTFNAKTLLWLGLFVNVLAVAVFSMSMNSYVMYTAKILIGLSEGLQWVWAPLWVVKWADEDDLPLWINLSGCVAAGVGNGLGILIAGFSTAHGFPYALPFQIEAFVLLLLFVAMLLTPSKWLAISSADGASGVKKEMVESERRLRSLSEISNADTVKNAETNRAGNSITPPIASGNFMNTIRVSEDQPLWQQLGLLWGNTLFCRSTMAFAMSNYINAGLAFIWIRLFLQLWALQKQICVISFLVITGAGGALGITLSSNIKDGGSTHRILVFLQKAMLVSCLGAVVTAAGGLTQLLEQGQEPVVQWSSMSLTWLGIVLVCVGLAATTGLIQIVCNNSVEDERVRSLGIGMVQVANNLIGNSLGPLLPQVVIDVLVSFCHVGESLALFFGALSIVFAAFLVSACVTSALRRVEKEHAEQEETSSTATKENSDKPLLSVCCRPDEEHEPFEYADWKNWTH
mmetsp:Transcript_30356/g.68077  ORF Transcript_30356/g.68077 Transcript_30356/m.68077 type:complete len:526 (+) Transcript_30356:34-1611(+)